METVEPFDKFLTTLKDDEWKNARSILTTAFTAGKLKWVLELLLIKINDQKLLLIFIPYYEQMMGSIGQTVDNFEKYLEDLVSKDELFDTRKLLNFASDALFSTFFGIDVDTIQQPDHPLVKVLLSLSPELSDPKTILFRKIKKY